MLVSRVSVTRFNTLVYIHEIYEYRLFMNKFAEIQGFGTTAILRILTFAVW